MTRVAKKTTSTNSVRPRFSPIRSEVMERSGWRLSALRAYAETLSRKPTGWPNPLSQAAVHLNALWVGGDGLGRAMAEAMGPPSPKSPTARSGHRSSHTARDVWTHSQMRSRLSSASANELLYDPCPLLCVP